MPIDIPQDPPAIVRTVEPDAPVIASGELLKSFGISNAQLTAKLDALQYESLGKIGDFIGDLNQHSSDAIRFRSGEGLSVRVMTETPMIKVVAEALRFNSPELVTIDHVKALRQANAGGDPEAIAALDQLAAQFSKGREAIGGVTIAQETDLKIISGESLRLQMMQTEMTIQLLDAIPGGMLTTGGQLSRNQAIQAGKAANIHYEVQAIALEAERGNAEQLRSAQNGTMKPLTNYEVRLDPAIVRLQQLVEQAQSPGIRMSAEQQQHIQDLARGVREQRALAYYDASEAASVVSVQGGKGATVIEHLRAAQQLVEQLPEAPQTEVRRISLQKRVNENASLALAREILHGTDQNAVEAMARTLFAPGFAEQALAEGYVRASQLHYASQYQGSDSFQAAIKKSYEKAHEYYDEALAALGVRVNDGFVAPYLNSEQRVVVRHAVDALLERALTEYSPQDVENLWNVRAKLIAAEPKESKDRLEAAFDVRVARAMFEHPERCPEAISAHFGVGKMDLQSLRLHLLSFVESEVKDLKSELQETPPEARNSAEFSERSYELGQAEVALSRMLVRGAVSSHDPEVKLQMFEKLSEFNQATRVEEEAVIAALKSERDELALRAARAQTGLETDALLIRSGALTADISARELSIAMLVAQQANVALAADEPTLRLKARELVDSLESKADVHPAIRMLVDEFRKEHQQQPLVAALEQFLAEVNKDYPLYTLAAMIGIGALGAAAASRWRGSSGALNTYLALSCGLLAGKIVAYPLMGSQQILTAWQTGMSSFNTAQSSLNVAYFFADAMQALPVFGAAAALWALSRRKDSSGAETPGAQAELTANLEKSESLLSKLPHETLEAAKLLLQPLDPRNVGTLNFWLFWGTVGLGGYQIAGGDIPVLDKQEELKILGEQILATLGAAVAYERVGYHLRNSATPAELTQAVVRELEKDSSSTTSA